MNADVHRTTFSTTAGRGMQPTDLRQANQRAVLTLIATEDGLSNARLSRLTGLAPQTVSAVLADLERAELVTRGAVVRGRRGQPATPLHLNPGGAFAIGAEIGWTHLEVVLVGFEGQTIARVRRPYDYPDAARVFGDLAQAIGEVTGALTNAQRARLIGMGLAVPNAIGDPGYLPRPGQESRLWAQADIAAEAARATGLDVRLFNDGNAACWAEAVSIRRLRPRGYLFFLIDTFVSGGVVTEGRLLEGRNSVSGNLGAMPILSRTGAPRFLNEVASLHVLRRRLLAQGLDLDAAGTPAAEGVVGEWIAEAATALASATLVATTVVDFGAVVIEAELPTAVRDWLVSAVGGQLEILPRLGGPLPRVEAGHLGHSGAAEGAGQLRIFRRYFSRQPEHLGD